jgi:hypothetical protein
VILVPGTPSCWRGQSLDFGRSRREASHPRHLGVARGFEPTTAYGGREATRLTKEASDELIAEAKDELAILREKAKGRRLRKEEIHPVITDRQRLTGWSEATVVDRLNLSKKKR